MDLRRAFARNSHIRAIEHRLICRHVVIDNFYNDVEFPDNDLTLILLVAEKCQALTHTHSLHVC